MSLKSYFSPQTIYTNNNKLKLVEVRERYGKLYLTINGRPQTNPQYQSNWDKLLTPIVGGAKSSQYHILVLGLGGGDVIKVVQKLNPGAVVTAVEIDNEVIQLAKKYFGIRATRKLKIVCEDAIEFMERNTEQFELVVVDLYDGDHIPSFVGSRKFLQQVASSTREKGSAIFNFASYAFKESNYSDFQEKLNSYYTEVLIKKYWGHNYYVAAN